MEMQLSEKERMFLEDGKIQEKVCVKKYQSYSQKTHDPELKQLFNNLSAEEQQHYDTINQMLQGQQPNMNNNQAKQPLSQNTATQKVIGNQQDKLLCNDLLSTEKYVSSTYNTDVFESANPTLRSTIQHIQQDEQRHGQELFNYMNSHGMYNVK